jgi:cytoskeletal protein CcmA (bactofilin family)
MSPSKHHNRLLLPLAMLLLTSAAWAQTQGREFHWSRKLAPENIVEIKDVNGFIEAGPASGDEVEVTAEKTGPRADEVKIEVVPHANGVTICAIFPRSDAHCEPGTGWHTSNNHGDDTKVNFTVRVPGNLRFSAQNVNGSVTAEKMGRFVHASSVNGRVRVSTKSWAEASSVNGSIEVSMGSADWTGTLRIATVNGSIKLELPGDLNADVSFRTVNGSLNSDFPLTVKGSLGGRIVNGRIGSGGRDLKVDTVNGSVELRRKEI